MDITLTFEPGFDRAYDAFEATPAGKQLLSLEGISRDKMDIGAMSHSFFRSNISDMTVDANANSNEYKSPAVYASEIAKGVMKAEGYYLLWRYAKKMYGEATATELMYSIWSGDVKFHDPSGIKIQVPYCWAFSTDMIMQSGNPYGQLHDLPPKTAKSFMEQVKECTHKMSQEFAGATVPSDMLINLAYFAKQESLSDKEIVNLFQGFVHSMNKPFRSGESPFTNVSLFDKYNLEKLFGDKYWPNDEKADLEYIMHVQQIIGEWFSSGDPRTGLPYRFPVMTINLMVDEDRRIMDREFLSWTAMNNAKKGCFNIYINDGAKLATCCRYSSSFEQMKFRADSFGNGGMNIGSHRVVTLNLPRIAHLSDKCDDVFFMALSDQLEVCYKLLMVHRDGILARRIRQGFLTFFSKPVEWFNINQLFSTIGITGIYEMCELMGHNILTPDGEQFTTRVLEFIEMKATMFSNRSGYSFNVEEIPGESACVTLARADRILYGMKYDLYSNQYIPLIVDATITKRAVLTGKFMSMLSGGGILHQNIKDKMSETQMLHMIEFHASVGVEHLGVNFGFGICANGHSSMVGNDGTCAECGAEIQDWVTRIIGYFSMVSKWSEARRTLDFVYRKFKNIGGK
jgi:ribonucleoside-triphosphate reductase